MTATLVKEDLRDRLKRRGIPAAPSVLRALLDEFAVPPEERRLDKIVGLISCDAVLTARCLGIVNSPLFGRAQRTVNLRAAVIALGANRLKDLLISASLMQFKPKDTCGISAVQVWEHAFACALMARRLALEIEYPEPDKIYLSALLHDIGVLVNMLCFPREFSEAIEIARRDDVDLLNVEKERLGFTHCDSGFVLGELWELPEEVKNSIAHHHDAQISNDLLLLALVQMGDSLAQWYGFDDGTCPPDMPSLIESANWQMLSKLASKAALNEVSLVSMFSDYAVEVKHLVAGLMRA